MESSNPTSESVIGVYSPAIMRWSSIFGGWFVATGVASLLYVGGLSLGFAAFDPHNVDRVAKGIGAGTEAWMVLTWIVALFLGGMFASWFDGRSDQTIGTLHGITVWGLSVSVSALLLTFGAMHMAQGGASLVHDDRITGTTESLLAKPSGAVMNTSSDRAFIALRAALMQRVSQIDERTTSIRNGHRDPLSLDRETAAEVAMALVKDDTENAKDLLLANTTMSSVEVDQTLQSVTEMVNRAKADFHTAAENTGRYIARAMCTLFLSILLGLVFAAFGGWAGAGHIKRIHHLRHYE